MAAKQTRQAVSVSREIYERLKVYAEVEGCSMSSIVEALVNEAINRAEREVAIGQRAAARSELSDRCETCGALPGERCRYIGERGSVRYQSVVHSSRARSAVAS
jgi:hypothetical protein